jgi:hypothetical protein
MTPITVVSQTSGLSVPTASDYKHAGSGKQPPNAIPARNSPLDRDCRIRILIIVLNFILCKLRLVITTKHPTTDHGHGNETRCECGQLNAKVVEGGLELKCKRCKRMVVIPFTAIEGAGNFAS